MALLIVLQLVALLLVMDLLVALELVVALLVVLLLVMDLLAALELVVALLVAVLLVALELVAPLGMMKILEN